MTAKVNREKSRAKSAGRPSGRATVFHGITAFCRRYGYAHQHVREVLTGRRRSARVRGLWAAWQAGSREQGKK